MSDNKDWLNEVLFKLRTTHEVEHNDNQWTTEFVYSLDEAKKLLLTKLEEAIGKDEKGHYPFVITEKQERQMVLESHRDDLRREIRQNLGLKERGDV